MMLNCLVAKVRSSTGIRLVAILIQFLVDLNFIYCQFSEILQFAVHGFNSMEVAVTSVSFSNRRLFR